MVIVMMMMMMMMSLSEDGPRLPDTGATLADCRVEIWGDGGAESSQELI